MSEIFKCGRVAAIMKMKMLRFFPALLVLLVAIASWAGPLDPFMRSAVETVQQSRRFFRLGSEVTVPEVLEISRIDSEKTIALIQARIAVLPQAITLHRDLGDAYHSMGHVFEALRDFDKALEYHRLALESYRLSGGAEAITSWGDGTVHAKEHIFMSLYDKGVFLESHGRLTGAALSLREAHAYVAQENLRVMSERFIDRYIDLIERPEFSPKAPTVLGKVRTWISSHRNQCALLFR